MVRYHGLDLLRAGAMLLGLVLHAALLFNEPSLMPKVLPGAGPAPEAAPGTTFLSLWIHLWRMPLFFVLAGFFAQMVITRKGAGAFLADRALRILCALLVFMSLFNLLTAQPFGRLDHLWFLWVLWACCLMAWAGARLGLGQVFQPALWLFASPRRLVWLVAAMALPTLALRPNLIAHHIPESLTDPEWRALLSFGLYFLVGQALWVQRHLIPHLARPRVFLAWLGAGLAMYAAIMTVAAALEGQDLPDWVWPPALWLLGSGAAALGTLGHVFGLMGLSEWALRRPSRSVRFLVSVAYPVYLLHLYPELVVSALLIGAGWPQGAVIAATALAGFAISLALYWVFIRYTPLSWLLNGLPRHRGPATEAPR